MKGVQEEIKKELGNNGRSWGGAGVDKGEKRTERSMDA